MDRKKLKATVTKEVEARQEELIKLSLRIHQNPELGFQEAKASRWLTSYLKRNGFKVEKGICQLATAFRGEYGTGKPRIALLAEYDALPKLGHACGHNIIAAIAVGAAVASRGAIDQLGGTVLVIGTPAEELHGGKVIMVKRGAFDDVDAAMMVHPSVLDIASIRALACIGLEVEFWGKAAHAAAHPEGGINALEAMLQAFNGINSLRQHIRDRARIHGIITHGGEAANIVPAYTAGSFLVRSEDEAYLDELKEKVLNCFKAASLASGARLEYKWSEVYYAPLRINLALAELFTKNMEALGRKVAPPMNQAFGSTDMGNVSVVVPSIHPMVAIAPVEVLAHSPEFCSAAASETGHRGLIDGAKALAMTVVDLIAEPEAMNRVREEFLAQG
ncbi:MAG: M20 family metallopeptidase [Dehalococcoidia bacterium]|nr:M20 family metallopeptidase [Chloroflexota bacterium]MCK4242535.1 M20 family metallopeptidase [Dehalococcoidia bacterium]